VRPFEESGRAGDEDDCAISPAHPLTHSPLHHLPSLEIKSIEFDAEPGGKQQVVISRA
jgi:hypothetical protein